MRKRRRRGGRGEREWLTRDLDTSITGIMHHGIKTEYPVSDTVSIASSNSNDKDDFEAEESPVQLLPSQPDLLFLRLIRRPIILLVPTVLMPTRGWRYICRDTLYTTYEVGLRDGGGWNMDLGTWVSYDGTVSLQISKHQRSTPKTRSI